MAQDLVEKGGEGAGGEEEIMKKIACTPSCYKEDV